MKFKLLSSTSIALALAVAAGWSPAVQAQGMSGGHTAPQAQERAQPSGESGRTGGHEQASPRAAQGAEHERGPAKSQATAREHQPGAGRGETAQGRSEHKGATSERASEQKPSGEKAAESKQKSEPSKEEKPGAAKEQADRDRGKPAEKDRATSEEKGTHKNAEQDKTKSKSDSTAREERTRTEKNKNAEKNGEKGAGKDVEKSAESDRTKSDRTKSDSAKSDSTKSESTKSTEQERNARSRDERNAKDRSTDTERTDRSARGGDQERIHSSVTLNERQRTRVKETFSRVDVEPVRNVDFSVTVGATVPRHVHLHPLPPALVEVVPEYRDYRYVVVNDEVVIINPQTYKVVTVVDRSGGGGRANVGARGSSERISLSQDQRRVIRSHVKVEDVTPPADTDIMIGKPVPRWVELFTFPDVVVKDVDVLRPYKYFTLNHEIVLVDPDDNTIVDVLN
jgi:hypothetical protein